ncbi:MAG: metal-dependent hydrolase [Actinobacteria bacterium]|nr:metal-dependent hydrolase [Actinomycetota bacterium]
MATIAWLGGSCIRLESARGTVVYVDPWLANENCPEEDRTPERVDVIALTHGHWDHLGETVELARRFEPQVLAVTELSWWLKAQELGATQVLPFNIGGGRDVLDIRVTMTDARHSTSVWPPGTPVGVPAGAPAGFVFDLDVATVYVAGDTGPFLDMQLIAELHPPDVAVLPVGDGTTMGPAGAARALELLGNPVCIPCHYDHPLRGTARRVAVAHSGSPRRPRTGRAPRPPRAAATRHQIAEQWRFRAEIQPPAGDATSSRMSSSTSSLFVSQSIKCPLPSIPRSRSATVAASAPQERKSAASSRVAASEWVGSLGATTVRIQRPS